MDLLLPAVGSCPCHAEPGLTHLPSNRPQAVSAQSLGQEVPAWGPAGAEPQMPTPRFAILPVLVPGRAAGGGRAEASGSGHIWWEGPWGPRGQGAETGRCGASVTAQRGTGVAPGGRPVRKMSLTGARETSITAHRHCSWGWGTRSQLGASQPPRRRGRAAGLAGARLRLAVRALSVLSCLKQQDSRAGP